MTKYTSSWAAAIGYDKSGIVQYQDAVHIHELTDHPHLAAAYETAEDALAAARGCLGGLVLQDTTRSNSHKEKTGFPLPVRSLYAVPISAKEKADSEKKMKK